MEQEQERFLSQKQKDKLQKFITDFQMEIKDGLDTPECLLVIVSSVDKKTEKEMEVSTLNVVNGTSKALYYSIAALMQKDKNFANVIFKAVERYNIEKSGFGEIFDFLKQLHEFAKNEKES